MTAEAITLAPGQVWVSARTGERITLGEREGNGWWKYGRGNRLFGDWLESAFLDWIRVSGARLAS